MDQNLFLVPATPRNNAYEILKRTVFNGVTKQFYTGYTDSDYGDPGRIWGLTSTFQQSWKHINKGDYALFYVAEDEYRYAARIRGTEENQRLGDAIRSDLLDGVDDRGDRDWTYLVFFDEPDRISVSGERIADRFDYRNDFPVRFIRVTDERLESLTPEFGSVDAFIDSLRIAE